MLLVSLLFWGISSHAHKHDLKGPMDLPPDATTSQLEWYAINNGLFQPHDASRPRPTGPIEDAIDYGMRNMAWLKHLNSKRPQNDKISLTNKASTGGYPPDQPSEYSPAIVGERLDKLKADMPKAMKEVIVDGKPLTQQLPVPVEEFIEWGRKTDRIYQTALRWKNAQPWLSWYETARAKDIRGIFFFTKMDATERTAKLTNPAALTEKEQSDFSDWLTSMCLNNGASLAVCRGHVQRAIESGQSLLPMFEAYETGATHVYNLNFTVQHARSDVKFDSQNLVEVPFRTPHDPKILAFVRDNIEDEWRSGTWALKLIFNLSAATQIQFVPGATPNVNGLGGNIITMNAEQPITEYDAQWTIRHEYGHVLGLPDCYVEYYDSERAVMVTYQIDIDNLMCSRHGHIQQKHVDELKRVYGARNLL